MAKLYVAAQLTRGGFTLYDDLVVLELGAYEMVEQAHFLVSHSNSELDNDEVFTLNDVEEEALLKYLTLRKERREDLAAEKVVMNRYGGGITGTLPHTCQGCGTLFDGGPPGPLEDLCARCAEQACPGCGSMPGRGINAKCNDAVGCGYWKSIEQATRLD